MSMSQFEGDGFAAEIAAGEIKRLGCISCRIINYVYTGDPEICGLCDIPLKTIEECERLIPKIDRVLNRGY
jgi:hypothetical protein